MAQILTPFEIMQQLISFPTVSSDSNLPLVEWVEGYLASHGITCHRFTDPDQPKAALFAHVGPQVEGAVVLSGHTDVVPVEGQAWDSDPYVVEERDGKYYGRGTCDMKGFDALAIWALVEAQNRGVTRPLQLALSYDEEIGCIGAPLMIEAMQGVIPKGSAVIVGEPSMMQAVTGHKGCYACSTHVQGFEVHSSLVHTGVSAIMQSSTLVEWTNSRNAENRAREPDAIAAMFEPPWSTLHVGVIEGGTAMNITAKDCRFSLDIRVLPSESSVDWHNSYMQQVRAVEARMQDIHPDTKIEVELISDVPGLKPETDGEAEALARTITGDNGSHVVSYGTEAGQFQQAGYSAVVCGPGDIAQAHQPNEYVTVAQFNAGHKFMQRLVQRLMG
ncbi:acetylornithine deacetylase [Parasedimentitalea psychrophila]|uniref:Acetylornithine deacetylase n=1 Tax=Parasedimentitalea psychrophila TaxID=2997337 RepID=A0A9Y2L140_9RHOB|nr:acetylornithine deacetylase [Parasedimentitalea psychrophila]WIY25462.1 acetylornithine deacetylase [Parasedimentitalea psychrophila]